MNIADYNRVFCRNPKALNYQRFRVMYFEGSRTTFKIFSSLKEAKNFFNNLRKQDVYLDDLLMNLTIKMK